MVCNPTSCAKRRRAGFTLVDYLVATSIGLVVLTAALVLWAFASRTCASLLNYVDLSSRSKLASDSVSQQIRNAKQVLSCSANQLVVRDFDGAQRSFTYDSSASRLVSIKGSSTNIMLTGCTNFQFSVYQRNPISNSFGLYTNAWNTNTAKVVVMQWACVRRLAGNKDNVASQLSAKVVIRNQ